MGEPGYLEAEPADLSGPVQIAPRVWWVGSVLVDDEFQTLAYLIEAGDQSVLIDPGSSLTIDAVLAKVEAVMPLDQVRWIVCHHADPDIADGLHRLGELITRPDAAIVTEWRAEALLKHYDAGLAFYRVEEHDWAVPLGEGRELRFLLTPYLHFPGALVSYDTASRVLFSSDIFGGLIDRVSLLAGPGYFDSMKPFHQHYMPSRELLAASLTRMREQFPDLAMVAPQHGCVIPGPLVPEMFEQLSRLECGVFSFASDDDDLDLARLIARATAVRRLRTALANSLTLPPLEREVLAALRMVGPVDEVGVWVREADHGWLEVAPLGGDGGVHRALPPPPAGSLRVDVPDAEPPLVVELRGVGEGGEELAELVREVSPSFRLVAARFLVRLALERDREALADLAAHDPLTGLLHRGALLDLDPAAPYAVLMVDLDHFKAVNDSWGHPAGDEVLRTAARAIERAVRSRDTAVRYGGEEFVVVLPETAAEAALAVAERVRAAVAADTAERGPCAVTASIGVAAGGDGEDVEACAVRADRALYRAKALGRDRVELDGPP